MVIDVPTAGHAIGKAPDVLTTTGIGSCVVICLYSQFQQTGAMIHYMLPRAEADNSNLYRYADTALSSVLSELNKAGVKKVNLTAKVIGGAQMFPSLAPSGEDNKSIGQRNSEEADLLLKTIGIPIMGRSTLGYNGKSASFDLTTGIVTVSGADSQASQTI